MNRRDSFYTTLCNALDYSCSVFPVTFVDPEVDDPHPPHRFYNHEDEHIYSFCESWRCSLELIGGKLNWRLQTIQSCFQDVRSPCS